MDGYDAHKAVTARAKRDNGMCEGGCGFPALSWAEDGTVSEEEWAAMDRDGESSDFCEGDCHQYEGHPWEDEPTGLVYSRLDPTGVYAHDGTKLGSTCGCEDYPCCGH